MHLMLQRLLMHLMLQRLLMHWLQCLPLHALSTSMLPWQPSHASLAVESISPCTP
jgi:hypothetical protein